MVFSSVTFIFVFFPLFLAAFAIFPRRNLIILLFSLLFYAWGEGLYVLLLLITVFINYMIGKIIAAPVKKTWVLAIGIAANLLILSYFKYFGFLVADVLQLDIPKDQLPHLPIGISFFIFQSISYLVDVYRGDAEEADSFSDLALYISMFPQLIAGPIVRYATVSEAIHYREIQWGNIRSGIALFIGGLCQKVLIANNVAEVADFVYSLPGDQLDFTAAWIGSLSYTLQIFFDFSGYSLMAIGIGRIMGFEFPVNFNYPYISTSITEFWRRWHMSLSSWFRDYLYIPLGGNRKGKLRTYLNLFIVFFLCGLWHGAAWTFIVWGLFHGALLILERMGLSKMLGRLPVLVSRIYTLLMVVIGWVLFRSESFNQAHVMLSAMFGGAKNDFIPYSQWLTSENMMFMLLGCVFSMPVVAWVRGSVTKRSVSVDNMSKVIIPVYSIILCVLFLFCSMYIMSGTYNPFIYFRF